jgi:hypothetical protein
VVTRWQSKSSQSAANKRQIHWVPISFDSEPLPELV